VGFMALAADSKFPFVHHPDHVELDPSPLVHDGIEIRVLQIAVAVSDDDAPDRDPFLPQECELVESHRRP
jgi:hypothetical protein